MPFAKKGGLFAAILIGALSGTGAARADVSDFIGNWANADSGTIGITRVLVMPAGGNQVKVRVFGACHPTDCDWGIVPGHSYTEDPGSHDVRSISTIFNTSFAHMQIILRKAQGNGLRFEVLTDFTDGSGRQDYDMNGKLTHTSFGGPGGGWGGGPGGGWGGGGPGGGGPRGSGWGGGPGGGPSPGLASEDCIGFNASAVIASYIGGSWKIVQGPISLLDFGANATAAHRAADTIHYYHFDQQCFVSRPNAQMMYWKRGSGVPGNSMGGQDCLNFNTTTVHVAHIGGNWKVVDGSQWILDYGPNKPQADLALAVIHNYHLNRYCYVQRPNAPMMYWLSQ